jgi:PilZ domain
MTIIVADPMRIPAIRDGMLLPGRLMYFAAGNLASAIETIRAHQPKLVVVDALFAQTPPGLAFVDRVEKLAIPQSDLRLVVQHEGRWVTAPRHSGTVHVGASPPAAAVVPGPAVVVVPDPALAAMQAAALNTRRAPRFLVLDAVNAVVESGSASLVDISVLGAQIVSGPILRPRQKIKIALPDTGEMLQVMAQVAWSTFEKPKLVMDARYRAGIEFTNAAQHALEDYRLRHCADQPIPIRG